TACAALSWASPKQSARQTCCEIPDLNLRYNEATAKHAGDLGRKRMAQVKITVRRNGPFRVEAPEGSVELIDADGNPYDLTGKPAFSLCRCGGSANKPFCDGTHSKIGFQAAELAVKKADEAPPEQPKS